LSTPVTIRARQASKCRGLPPIFLSNPATRSRWCNNVAIAAALVPHIPRGAAKFHSASTESADRRTRRQRQNNPSIKAAFFSAAPLCSHFLSHACPIALFPSALESPIQTRAPLSTRPTAQRPNQAGSERAQTYRLKITTRERCSRFILRVIKLQRTGAVQRDPPELISSCGTVRVCRQATSPHADSQIVQVECPAIAWAEATRATGPHLKTHA
jgi:hypothetical protein